MKRSGTSVPEESELKQRPLLVAIFPGGGVVVTAEGVVPPIAWLARSAIAHWRKRREIRRLESAFAFEPDLPPGAPAR